MPKVIPAGRRRAALSRERIASLAFELVDREGLAALSMRRLAAGLGCQAMSLYHHVAHLDALLDLVVDELLGRCELPAADAAASPDSLLRLARRFLDLARVHPRVFQLVVGRPWRGSRALALAMVLVRQFEALGLAPRNALRAARVLGGYLNGSGMALAGWQLQQPRAVRTDDDDAGAAWLRKQSRPEAVRADLDAGLALLIGALLAGAAPIPAPLPPVRPRNHAAGGASRRGKGGPGS